MSTPSINIESQIAPVPAGFKGTANDLLTHIQENSTFQATGSILVGQINGANPGANIGVWFDGRDVKVWDSLTQQYVLINTVPVGSIIDFCGVAAPAHYLECDGSELVRTSYEALFNTIGTTWNKSSDSDPTKFRLPDLRGRVAVGRGLGDYNADGNGSVIGRMVERLFGAYWGFESLFKGTKISGQPASALMNNRGTQVYTDATYDGVAPPSVAVKKLIRYE